LEPVLSLLWAVPPGMASEVGWDDDEVRATLRELLEEADSGPASAD